MLNICTKPVRKSNFSFFNKKAELTPGLARDRAATWRLTVNLDSSAAILTVRLVLPPGESDRTPTILACFPDPPSFDASARRSGGSRRNFWMKLILETGEEWGYCTVKTA